MRTLTSALAAAMLTGAVGVGTASAASAAPPTGPNLYPVVLSGDFTGDGEEDLFFHSPGSTTDVMYDFEVPTGGGPQTLVTRTFTVTGTYRPVAGDFTGDNVDDLFWYRPGTGSDVVWDFQASATAFYARRPFVANGTYRLVAGDFTNDDVDDVFFYGPGSTPDSIWELGPTLGNLSYRSVAQSVNGSGYQPVAGKFSSVLGGGDDIFWYNPSGTESIWDYPSGNSLAPDKASPAALQVGGTTYRLAVADLFDDDDYEDIIFVGPGAVGDSIWDFYDLPGGGLSKIPAPEPLNQNYTAVVGLDSWGEGTEDFFVYNPAANSGALYDYFQDGPDYFWEKTPYEPAPLTSLRTTAATTSSGDRGANGQVLR